ncbi:universal stress protein [Rubrivivax albus]|uniref:Universal stress protein n=1 Tax=Rubrivivax albus TaxID=2499835 RepID=A0A3S2TP56_9BURK|nr:universal stress protein [Rubrivivax albus]RVT49592.1 universal stress protein [Rubrivivax albus]
MNKILACIDTRGNTDAVIDWAAWAAVRLDGPLEFLHVLERHPEVAAVTDFSGAIGVDAQESLLKELSDQDEQQSVAMRNAGRGLLSHARNRAAAAGARRLDARLRHGDFIDTAIELQGEVDLFVLGEHYHAAAQARTRAEHHLERVIRSVSSSVLVATAEAFEAPQRVVVAFDGSPGARKALARLATHPLVAGLPVLVAMAAPDTPAARQQIKEARTVLQSAGAHAEAELAAGEPHHVLPELVKRQAPALLVMGAFGHSRLRQLLFGSTTASLLRLSDVPVLILR